MTLYADNYIGYRYASDLNDWIDFVVLVPTPSQGDESERIIKAMDAFWNREQPDTYSEYIEEAFPDSIILYHDSEDDSEEYEKKWNETLDSIYWVWADR